MLEGWRVDAIERVLRGKIPEFVELWITNCMDWSIEHEKAMMASAKDLALLLSVTVESDESFNVRFP